MRLFIVITILCLLLQILYVAMVSLYFLCYSWHISNISSTLITYSLTLLYGAVKYRKFFHLILSLLLAILALYTFFYHYLYKSRGFSMARVQVIPRVIDNINHHYWFEAIDIVKSVIVNYLLGHYQYTTNLKTHPKIVKRMLKILKLLGFRVEIRKIVKANKIYHQIIIKEVKEPRKGLLHLIRFAPIIEVKIWLEFLLKLLTRQKGMIPPSDVAILRRFGNWWATILELQEKGLIRIESRLVYCDDEYEECEYDYTIYIYP